MPRKTGAILPVAAEQASRAAEQAILASPSCQRSRAPHRPVDLASGLLRQAMEMRWMLGDFSPAVALADALYERQIALTAVMLYRDHRVQMHWDLPELREFLDIELKRSLGMVSNRAVVIKCPPGRPLGSEESRVRFDPEKSFAEVIRKARDELGEHATHTEIWSHIGMPSATYYRHLAKERRGKNKVRGAR